MKHTHIAFAASAFLAVALSAQAGPPVFNDTVTAIYGTGNPDGGFTTATSGNLELGLQLKNSIPADTTNTNGVYSVPLGTVESLVFSVNTDVLGTGSDLSTGDTFLLTGGTDPSDTSLFSFSPTLIGDNAYGTSSTANGGGTVGTFADESATNSIMQNSEKLSFGFMGGVDVNVPGVYDYELTAFNADHRVIDQVEVQAVFGTPTVAVPDATSSALLLAIGLVGMAIAGTRARRILSAAS